MMKIIKISLLLLFSACGLYQAPLPPEALSPQVIRQIKFTTFDDSIQIAWNSPEKDRRGEDLKFIDGYQILKKGPATSFEELGEQEFQKKDFIVDKHLIVQKELRDKAISEGKISRKVKAPEDLRTFSFTDKDLAQDMFYAYQVIPVNQGNVEGVESDLIQMQFLGLSSKVYSLSSQHLVPQQLDQVEKSEEALN